MPAGESGEEQEADKGEDDGNNTGNQLVDDFQGMLDQKLTSGRERQSCP